MSLFYSWKRGGNYGRHQEIRDVYHYQLPLENMIRYLHVLFTPVLLCASGTYLRVKNDFNRPIFWYVFMWYDLSARRRDSTVFFQTQPPWIGECSPRPSLQSTLSRRQNGKCIRRRHMRAQVNGSVTCAVPTWHHINTDKARAFHCPALLSRLGWLYVLFGTNLF